jgi:hypothetical protein
MLEVAEVNFIRGNTGYTLLGNKRNEEIVSELQIPQMTEYVEQYRRNWKEDVDRKSSGMISKMIFKYQPNRKRNLGRSLKEWNDSVL